MQSGWFQMFSFFLEVHGITNGLTMEAVKLFLHCLRPSAVRPYISPTQRRLPPVQSAKWTPLCCLISSSVKKTNITSLHTHTHTPFIPFTYKVAVTVSTVSVDASSNLINDGGTEAADRSPSAVCLTNRNSQLLHHFLIFSHCESHWQHTFSDAISMWRLNFNVSFSRRK